MLLFPSSIASLPPPLLNLKTESAPDTVLAESGAYLFSEDSQVGLIEGTKVGKHVGNKLGNKSKANLSNLYSVPEASKILGVPDRTLRLWCETGKIPCVHKSYGTKVRYLISKGTIETLQSPKQSIVSDELGNQPLGEHKTLVKGWRETMEQTCQQAQSKPHPEFVKAWVAAMSTGLLTGKPYSSSLVQDYEKYIGLYFKHCKAVSIDGLKAGLARIPVESVAKRQHFYKAVRCFAKYLISEGVLESGFIEGIKPLAPKYHRPPKRNSITADELEALIKACDTVLDRTLVILLASTGLRASELCVLQYRDINLQEGFLTVRCGKGGKTRKVGLNTDCRQALAVYLPKQPSKVTKNVFLNVYGKPMDRNGLYQRLERLGKLAGIKVSPHALRRAFVTINANAGRPLQMLQIACGHSSIKTTMDYCRTSEQEVIEAMKGWD